jgi:hypothetical protein
LLPSRLSRHFKLEFGWSEEDDSHPPSLQLMSE